MAKKKPARASAEPASPKRLRRKLEKLEARLASASDKRDRAQARVDALAILTDEVRASIAAAERPASEPEAPGQPPPVPKAPISSKPAAAKTTPRKPASGTRARRTTRTSGTGQSTRTTSSRSTSTRTRRRPSSGGPGPASGTS